MSICCHSVKPKNRRRKFNRKTLLQSLYEAMRKRFAVITAKIVYPKKCDSYRSAFIHIEKLQIDVHIVQNHENGFLLQKFVEKC